jgi:hypothetical protein
VHIQTSNAAMATPSPPLLSVESTRTAPELRRRPARRDALPRSRRFYRLDSPAGTVVRGTLYVDDFVDSTQFLSGSQLMALPYSYTIG